MSIALLLIPLGLLLLGVAVWAFFWAVNNDQFEDLDHVAEHILDEEANHAARQLLDEQPAAPALPKSPC